jgi:hypothetical protein
MKRDTAATIFRTVVFAGAMLGAPACSKKQASTTPPTNTATEPAPPTDNQTANPTDGNDPCADPCADPCGRPRGSDDDGGGGMGRGFILS